MRKINRDPALCARLYSQSLFPSEERQFLLNPHDGKVQHLVSNLNLVLDSDNLIRTRGRIDKARFFDYEVLYPVLLPIQSHLTRLIILNYHHDCKQSFLPPLISSGYLDYGYIELGKILKQ